MSDRQQAPRERASHGPLRSSVVLTRCFLRGLPYFFRATPATPLRVLGIMALNTLRVLRTSRPLSERKTRDLAMVMDFLGSTNATWDDKHPNKAQHQALRHRLEDAGLGACIDGYLTQLQLLESRRPAIRGGEQRCADARSYREAVAHLCVAVVTAIALELNLEDAIHVAHDDADVDALVRILLQCQIIDDIVDYRGDLAAGLPSFLTATSSLAQALSLATGAARSYGARPAGSRPGILPFRLTLGVFTVAAKIALRAAPAMTRPRRDSRITIADQAAGRAEHPQVKS